ncbi:hypothetical protein F2Q70_00036921 [Brassica cretica]|uniref:S1 motif domain-containing protein n=1 Tax=Brassica cretica TaxID=69181 RepID=A0A8S9JZ33_BRACR|nr:hypothetical protein F2Q70_00036921 [Brassica cretica]
MSLILGLAFSIDAPDWWTHGEGANPMMFTKKLMFLRGQIDPVVFIKKLFRAKIYAVLYRIDYGHEENPQGIRKPNNHFLPPPKKVEAKISDGTETQPKKDTAPPPPEISTSTKHQAKNKKPRGFKKNLIQKIRWQQRDRAAKELSNDPDVNDVGTNEEPFAKFRVGQSVSARVVANPCHTDNRKSQLWELSVKPAILRDSGELTEVREQLEFVSGELVCVMSTKWIKNGSIGREKIKFLFLFQKQMSLGRKANQMKFGELTEVREQLEFVSGELVCGYVYKVDKEWVWLAISRNATARISIGREKIKFLFLFKKQMSLGSKANQLSSYLKF